MGIFEENPWVLVPFVLAIVVAYDLAKKLAAAAVGLARKNNRRADV